jgi:hypothetical protein
MRLLRCANATVDGWAFHRSEVATDLLHSLLERLPVVLKVQTHEYAAAVNTELSQCFLQVCECFDGSAHYIDRWLLVVQPQGTRVRLYRSLSQVQLPLWLTSNTFLELPQHQP